jgi:hypothetical protein
MGGLVCRVANIALEGANLASVMAGQGKSWAYPPADIERAEVFGRRSVPVQKAEICGVITLAAPNSGAMTKAQTASLVNLATLWHGISPGSLVGAAKSLGSVASAYFNARYESTKDLTGIRVFRMFQHFHVGNRCLSISGSKINMLAGANLLGKSIKFAGVEVALPNDEIVEDRSVDLNQSVLPHEFDHGQYTHVRAYEDCTFVDHFNIYDMHVVRESWLWPVEEQLGKGNGKRWRARSDGLRPAGHPLVHSESWSRLSEHDGRRRPLVSSVPIKHSALNSPYPSPNAPTAACYPHAAFFVSASTARITSSKFAP